MTVSQSAAEKGQRMCIEFTRAMWAVGFSRQEAGEILLYGALTHLDLDKPVNSHQELQAEVDSAIVALKIRKMCT